ncbi:MAG: tRNA uridine-5-carboxymethylaminomethyl(34) synthesis GTPase MnmE [Weeksellaceae bacterium]|nr:tRNA uridine-5-carboxymethylaminomethyl(34) synthesis GTPase MnmE [Weeksellaceae bacterium]
MQNFDSSHNPIIVAPTTGTAQAAVAMIRLSGSGSIDLLSQFFKPASGASIVQAQGYSLHFGQIMQQDKVLDEVLVTIFRGPKSYTGEDVVEISCHASSYIVEQILQLCQKHGAKPAQRGEFTQRAFLNGKLDLAQAEAVGELIASENAASHQIALNQLKGTVSSKMQQLRSQLIRFTALIELELDFAEEDVEFADRSGLQQLLQTLNTELETLISTFAYGNALKKGVPVAILGKPNAGKSTLLNALLQEERAIVSEIAGTTRDTIEEVLHLEGIAFRFIDTAGLRSTSDTIEAIGVQRALEKAKTAHIILYLFNHEADDVAQIAEQLTEWQQQGSKIIAIHNKTDLVGENMQFNEELEKLTGIEIINISAKKEQSIDLLKERLLTKVRGTWDESQTIISNQRHHDALVQAKESLQQVKQSLDTGLSGELISFHLRDALRSLGTVTGEIEHDRDILGTIFGEFCIGK